MNVNRSQPIPSLNRLWAYVRWAVALLAFGSLTAAFIEQARLNSPYEGWDEIATFNNSSVMWSPLRTRTYAYGFLDTAKMALGRYLHEGSLSPGMCMGERTFTNNVPASLSTPDFNIAQRNWTEMSAIDFNYFRGLTDRRGLFFARLINIALLFLLALSILGVLELMLGPNAMIMGGVALLWLMSSHEFVSQAPQALPNATNALLALLVALLCGGALLLNQWRWLMLAAAVIPIGVNHKIDFIIFGFPLASTFVLLAFQYRRQPRRIFSMTALLLLVTAATSFLSNPCLLTQPLVEASRQIREVRSITSSAVDVPKNWAIFYTFASQLFSGNVSGPPATPVWLGAGLLSWILTASLLSIGEQPRLWGRRCSTFVILFATGALLCLIPIYRSNALYSRYFLNGAGALLALPILGFPRTLAALSKFRLTAVTVLIIGAVFVLVVRGGSLHEAVSSTTSHFDIHTGLDLSLSRNRAVHYLLEHRSAGKLSNRVIVDQHGYFDLGALRAAGLTPIFVNCLTYAEVLGTLPSGNYAVLAVAGDYEIEPRWAGLWDASLRTKYDLYWSHLAQLPRLYSTGAHQMKLLSWQPPVTDDQVIVSIFSVK